MRWFIFLPYFIFLLVAIISYPMVVNSRDAEPVTVGLASMTTATCLWLLLGGWYFAAHSTSPVLSTVLAMAIAANAIRDIYITSGQIGKITSRSSAAKFFTTTLLLLGAWTTLFVLSV